MKYILVSQCKEIYRVPVIFWTFVSIMLFSYARWTEVLALQRKPTIYFLVIVLFKVVTEDTSQYNKGDTVIGYRH